MTKRTALEVFESKVQRGERCWEMTGYHSKDGYSRVHVGDKCFQGHRLSWELHNGPIPAGKQIDHTCYNKGCANPAHLRLVTAKQNCENKPKARADNTTGVKGVWWRSDKQRYVAQVTHNGKRVFVKYFTDLDEAEAAVIEARRQWFTHNDFEKSA